ncbi:MAG: hypothetical protein KY476_15595 [Planctomycetes bacterium]|nr:hypothetical protein [Planctomycetota bacterium]
MGTLILLSLLAGADGRANAAAAHPLAAPGITTLTNDRVRYREAPEHFAVLRRGGVTAVVVDNSAIDNDVLPGHRAGYNGMASLTHVRSDKNLFVPAYAGLNLEHIHDGTLAVTREKYEPRTAPMQLRLIDEHTVELYQPPTPNWKLESCGRYRLLEDGVIEYTFECIPRADVFEQGWIGLFWASYIHQPRDGAIHFIGRRTDGEGPGDWLRAESPQHGVDSTHPPSRRLRPIDIHPEFPLTLVNHRSPFVSTEPWYYGVSNGMAYVLMFRPQDAIWFVQSPSGGGRGNPAWDFQWFIPDYRVGEAYGFVMRAAYLPFESREQIERDTRRHREALDP